MTNVDFEGCLDSLQIGSSLMKWDVNKEAFGMTPGCPVKVRNTDYLVAMRVFFVTH